MDNLNTLRDKAHANAIEKGFWDTPQSDKHCLMLVITELSEAIEADRKTKRAQIPMFKYETSLLKGHETSQWQYYFRITIYNSVENELADAFICTLDFAGARGLDLVIDPLVVEEMAESCVGKTFTETIYSIIDLYIITDDVDINRILHAILGLAKSLKIDLSWYIEQKMKYNELREKKHGKKY